MRGLLKPLLLVAVVLLAPITAYAQATGAIAGIVRDPSGGARPTAQGLADLLWAVTMKPEFQLIY